MKTNLLLPSVALSFLFLLNQHASAQDNIKNIVRHNKSSMAPYEYDAYAIKEITYGPKERTVVVEFAVYSDEDYKIIFCKTFLPQSVDINIYDKNPKNKNKKLIYFDESGRKDQYVCNFRPTTTGQYYIEYKIPAATEPNQKGAIIILIGLKDSNSILAEK